MMKIIMGCDHGGFELKETLKKVLIEKGYEVEDYGIHKQERVDYPDYAQKVGEAIASGKGDQGILICGTGIGMAVAANKINGIRAVNAINTQFAELCREHNDANMMALGAGFVGELLALEIVDTFLDTPFSNGERHKRRIEKLMAVEQG